jgi:aspartyl-tRNA(Asn)/glutamyl-tRNA(Gln) amidotransferase subunit C
MAQLTPDTLKKLTELSRIDCTPEEQTSLLKDLDSILGYMALLNEIDTSDVPPCNYVIPHDKNVTRDDVVGETLPRDVFLKNAPSHTGGMIRVPPVLKSNT